MNGKKSKLLRKIAKSNAADKEQPFAVVHALKSDRQYTLANGSMIVLPLAGRSIDRTSAKYLYKQMKHSYHEMKPLYKGLKAHKL